MYIYIHTYIHTYVPKYIYIYIVIYIYMQGCIYLEILTLGGGISAKLFGGKIWKGGTEKEENMKDKENLKLKGQEGQQQSQKTVWGAMFGILREGGGYSWEPLYRSLYVDI